MRRPMLLVAVGFVSGIGGISACGGNDTLEDPLFAAEVTGAVTRTAAGHAAFGVAGGGVTGFMIIMQDDTSGTTIALQKPGTSRPVAGDYPIRPPEDVGPIGEYRAVVRLVVNGTLEEYEARSGVLKVRDADSPLYIQGTVDLQAVRTSPCCDPEPVTISVTGVYLALQGTGLVALP